MLMRGAVEAARGARRDEGESGQYVARYQDHVLAHEKEHIRQRERVLDVKDCRWLPIVSVSLRASLGSSHYLSEAPVEHQLKRPRARHQRNPRTR